jgi:hypothetical protein
LGTLQDPGKSTRHENPTITWQPLNIYYQSLKGSSPDQRISPRYLKLTAICGTLKAHGSIYVFMDIDILVGPTPTRSEDVIESQIRLEIDMWGTSFQGCLAMYFQGKEPPGIEGTLSISADLGKDVFLLLQPVAGKGVYERIGVAFPCTKDFDIDSAWREHPEVFRTVVIV